MRVFDVFWFIALRESARLNAHGQILSVDLIIGTYRFCNMRREHDRVTLWIAANWRQPNIDDPDLWFAMCVARMALNEIETMKELGYPVPWNADKFLSTIIERKEKNLRIYNPAYMIATPNWTGPKHLFLTTKLLNPMWENRIALRPNRNDTLQTFYTRLHSCYGVGTFTAGQVVADVKHTPGLLHASDWWTWAPPGPGSLRGLNRVYDREVNTPWRLSEWTEKLNRLLVEVNKWFPSDPFHAQDLQNVMCEFDKYERARTGEGRPKQKYTPFVNVKAVT